MSRRLRNEEEALKRLQEEKDDEKDAQKQFMESLYAPIIWQRFTNGIKIQDLREPFFDTVLKFIEVGFLITKCQKCLLNSGANFSNSVPGLLHD